MPGLNAAQAQQMQEEKQELEEENKQLKQQLTTLAQLMEELRTELKTLRESQGKSGAVNSGAPTPVEEKVSDSKATYAARKAKEKELKQQKEKEVSSKS